MANSGTRQIVSLPTPMKIIQIAVVAAAAAPHAGAPVTQADPDKR